MNSKSQADTTSSTRSEYIDSDGTVEPMDRQVTEYSDWTRNLEQRVEMDRLEVGVDGDGVTDIGVSSGARSQSRRPGLAVVAAVV